MNVTGLSNKPNCTEHTDSCQYAVTALLGTLKESVMTSAEYKHFHNEAHVRSQLWIQACKYFSDI